MEFEFLEKLSVYGSYLGAFALVMLIIVGIHEYGHFLVARLCKIKVLEFSIGMGKKLFSYTGRSGTQYSLSLLPIGGYVKMLDEEEMSKEDLSTYSEDDLKHSFNRANRLQKLAVIGAGPFFNFICAIAFFSAVNIHGVTDIKPYIGAYQNANLSHTIVSESERAPFLPGDLITEIEGKEVENWMDVFMHISSHVGNEDPFSVSVLNDGEARKVQLDFSGVTLSKENHDIVSSIGLIPTHLNYGTTVQIVPKSSPIEKAGIKPDDRVIAINDLKVERFYQVAEAVKSSNGEDLKFTVSRDGSRFDVTVKPQRLDDTYKIGFVPQIVETSIPFTDQVYTHKYSISDAVVKGFKQTVEATEITFSFIKKLATGDVSPTMISGPIGIAEIAGKSAHQGITQFFKFIALISVNIMIMNLLPIPALDGGHILRYSLEIVTRREINKKLEKMLYKFGVAALLSLMLLGIISDIINITS